MKIPQKLDDYFNNQYNSVYNQNSKEIIETHSIKFSQMMYDNMKFMYGNVYEYEAYYCETCQCNLREIIWFNINLSWNPMSCNDLIIKKLLE